MKLKRLPEDFQVTELTTVQTGGGDFALYKLRKTSLGTLEAIELLQRKWNLARHRVSWGGLKDRHAVTEQFVSVRHGPERSLQEKLLDVSWIGRTNRPFTPAEISGNRFRIVLRDLTPSELDRARTSVPEVARDGVPNYFDDQRFGSLGESGEFIARPWCQGNYERALWLALADPHPDDKADERRQKQILRDHWGRWRECKAALDRSHRRSVITYLADRPPEAPSDFRGAFARMKVDLRGLYLSAFQSAIWNRMLATFLQQECPADQLLSVPLQLGDAPFFRSLNEETRARLTSAALPLPSARLHLDPGSMHDLIQTALKPEGMELREMRVKYPRDSFFSRGERKARVVPLGLTAETAADELYSGRSKLTLEFELPRGSYATLVVKRLTEI